MAQALHQQTGIPIGQIAGQEQDRLARMEEILHQRIVGQDAAISALARSVRRARAGLKDPKRPIGSFLFLGPSGVGKTESALALAEFLFGTEDAVITLNMSEYMEKHNVARLIGAPPGYVGYDEGGQLTERVRQRPYAVVLVDEVEKAHPDVYDLFLQVLDQGQLQDSRGRAVSFRNTVVVMTSNLGTRGLAFPEELPPGEDPKGAVLAAVRDHFRPEFLNRLDGVIVFDPLDRPALRQILDLMLGKIVRQLSEQGITLDVTPAAREWLVDQHHEPAYGARPLNRILQTYVKDEVSERLINGSLLPGQRITVDVEPLPAPAPSAPVAPAEGAPAGGAAGRGAGAGDAPGLPQRMTAMDEQTRHTVRDLVLDEDRFRRLTLNTGRQTAPDAWRRVVVRPVQLRGRRHLQFSYFDARQDVTKNYAGPAATRRLEELLHLPARAISVQSAHQTLNVQITKSGKAILHRLPPERRHPSPFNRERATRHRRGGDREQDPGEPEAPAEISGPDLRHNRRKEHPLPEGVPDPLLQALEIMDAEGRVRSGMRGKFTQVNEFLKLLEHSGA